MAKQTKFKFYFHHKKFVPVSLVKKAPLLTRFINKVFNFFYQVGFTLIKFGGFVINIIAVFFYNLGSSIIKVVAGIYNIAKKDVLKTLELAPKRFAAAWQVKFAKSLSLFLAVAILGWLGIGSLHLIAKALQLKSSIVTTAAIGNSYLAKAKSDMAAEDFTGAQSSFSRAYETFTQGQSQISQSGQALNQLLGLLPQKQAADGLLEAAALISSSGQDFISLENQFKTLQISSAGVSFQDQSPDEVLQSMDSNLNSALSKVTQASDIISKIDPGTLPQEDRENFVSLSDQLSAGQLALTNFQQVFELAKNLLTGDKTVLLMFENNNELRAGGGFMGTYGALKMNNGGISKITVSSIYDLDGQLTNVIKPPQPILNLSDRWYMRDSNWFADFPQSAREISNFYELEAGETPDMIIAMTPNLIIDFLKITGPITLPNYGITLSADNFVEQTQAATTISDNLPTNSPKQILADFVPILLQKISSTGKDQWPQIIQSLQDELNNKQIVAYSRDPDIENEFNSFNWGGGVQNTDRDYFSIVSSNLGGTKTDLNVDQQINFTTTINSDGSINDEVDITRTNKTPDLPDTENDSYLRIYAPLGSTLISNIGFDYKDLEYPTQDKYEINDDVYAWEKNSVTDNLTGTTIGQEAGKTFFGNWLDIKGGETKTVKLVYQLPFKLQDVDRYSLLLQKQIGANNSDFNWTLNFPGRNIAWKNFDTNNLNTDNLNSDILLDKDYFLGLVFAKQ